MAKNQLKPFQILLLFMDVDNGEYLPSLFFFLTPDFSLASHLYHLYHFEEHAFCFSPRAVLNGGNGICETRWHLSKHLLILDYSSCLYIYIYLCNNSRMAQVAAAPHTGHVCQIRLQR